MRKSRKSPLQTIGLGAILIYRNILSPTMLHSCRFTPSCSEYAAQAIERFGMLQGCLRAFWRIMRCNPFSRKIYDPAK